MTPREKKTSGVSRALVTGLAAVYFLTNVAAVHAAESNFWSERRRAASLQWGEPDAASPSRGGQLYARLPAAPSPGPDLSSLWEQPVHRVSQDLALSSTAHIARAPDARLLAVAQAISPFGQVRRIKTAPAVDAPLVLHIQDVHGNVEAQRNMSGMVLALAQKQSPLVGLEGASGAFDIDSFHAYPDADIVKNVADFFLEKDLIGGPEHAGLVASKSITLWGVEDAALYLSHVEAVKASLAGRARAESLAAEWTAGIDELKQKHFSSALRDYDQNQSLYEQDKRGLGAYVEALKSFQKGGAKSADALPNVEKLLVAARREKNMDFDAIENERRSLVEGLATRLSVPELQDLVRRSLDLKSGAMSQRAYQAHLRALCVRHKLDLSRYPRLGDYMTYVADSESIERDTLLDELARLETAAQDALVQTPNQRALVGLSRDLVRFKKMIANEMTPADWAAYEPRRAEMAQMGRRLASVTGGRAVPGPADWDAFIGPYEGFCRKALARDVALADRLLEKMKTERKTTAVLVAGGFHTDGVVELLAARGVTVAVLTPKIGPIDGTANYLDVFANDPLPVEKIFAGEPIALKAICGLAGGALEGDQTARVHAAVATKTLMEYLKDLRGLGHSARTIGRELPEYLLAMAQVVTGLALIQPHVRLVGTDGLTFSYRMPNGSEEILESREREEGVVVNGARKTGPLTWLRGVWAIVSRPRPVREQTPQKGDDVPVAEGSFFQVREIAPGKLAKEVKEVVGPRGDVQYELSEADRERLAQLIVEYADRIRESVSRASGGRVEVSRFERKGRVLFVDKAPGAPRIRETAEDRKTYLDAMRGADNALGLDGLNDPIYTPDGWRIHVDRGSQNLFYSDDGKTVTWIDPVTVWPPADRRVGSALRVSPLAREWGVAWRESYGFLRPLAFFRAHTSWTAANRWVGALLIVGLWGVFGETAAGVFQWATAIFSLEGSAQGAIFAAGVLVGWAVTMPLHAGWNLLAERVNAVLARRAGVFRLPRLTIHEDMSNEFEAIEANLQTLRNGLNFIEKQKANPSVRLQVVELYLQTIDRLTRLMADMGKYLPKQNVQKFRSRIFASQDWLPSPGKIINLIELIGKDGNYQTAHGFLGQIGRYTEFVSPLDTARLKDTQTALRQAALQAEIQRMKGVRPNGKQVRAITASLALTKADEHWLDVYAALEREGLDVSFERMAAVGKRSPAEYKRIWEDSLGVVLEANWAGEIKSLPGEESLTADLKTAMDLLVESEPAAEDFLKKMPDVEALIENIAETSGHPKPLVTLWLNVGTKKGDYAKLVHSLTVASPMVVVDQHGEEWRVMAVPKMFKNVKPSMAGIVTGLARKLIDLGDGAQSRGDEYSRRGVLREKWGTDWWIFGKKLADEKTLMIYWFGSGSKAHAPGDSYAANPAVRDTVFANDDFYNTSNAATLMSDLTERAPPKGGALTLQETYDKFAGTRFGAWVRARFGEAVFRRTTEIVAAPWFEFAQLNDAKAFADAHTHLNASERNLRRWATYGIHVVAAGVSGMVAFALAGVIVAPVASVGGLLGIGLSGLALAPPLVIVALAFFLGPALGYLSTIPTHTLWNFINTLRRETRPVAEAIVVPAIKFTDSFISDPRFSLAGLHGISLKELNFVNPPASGAATDITDILNGLFIDREFSKKGIDLSRILRSFVGPKQGITDVFPPSMTFGLEIEFHKDKQPDPDVIRQIEPILKKYGWYLEPSELGTYLYEIRNSSDKKEILRNTPEDWQRLKDCLDALQSGPLSGGFYSVHMHVGQEEVTGEDLREKRESLGRIAKAYEALWRALSGRRYTVPGGNLTVLANGALTGIDKTVMYHSSIINMSKMYPTIEIKIISGLLNDRGHLDIENLQEQLWFAFALFRAAVHRGNETPLALMGRPVVAGEKPSDRQIEAFLDRIYQGDPRGRIIARRVFDNLAGEAPGLTSGQLAIEQSKIQKAYESAGLGVLYRLHHEAEGHIDYEIVEHLLEPSRLEALATDLVAAGASDEQALGFFPGDMYVPLLEALKAAREKLADQFWLRPEDYQRRIADLLRIYNPVVPRVEFSRYLREIRVDRTRDRLAQGLFDDALRGRSELAPLRRLNLEALRHFNVEPLRLNNPTTFKEIRPISSVQFKFTEIKLPWWFRTAVVVQKFFSMVGFFGIPLIPTSFPWMVVSAIGALSQTLKSVSTLFRSSPFLYGLVLPLFETMMLLSLNPSLEHWFAALGMDPTGGVLAMSAGLVFSLPHILSRSLEGERIPAKDIAIWTGAGALFSALLTIPGGFALSLGLHSAFNNMLLVARQESFQKRFPRLSGFLSKIPLLSIMPVPTGGRVSVGLNPSARKAPTSTLLTEERLRRNNEIAAGTGGRKSVLYFGAGLDLSGVLTTFPEVEHVRMVALSYGPIDVHVVRDYMENPRVGDAVINDYVEHVMRTGYAPSGLVDDLSNQLKLLATELTALGVNPQSLSQASTGNGIEFTTPWNPSGRVVVTFSASPSGGIRLTDTVGSGWTEFIGDLRFDAFYFKAGEKMARELSSLLARATEFFSDNVLLVVNNIPRDGNRKGSVNARFGFSLGEQRWVGVDSNGNYGNAFAMVEMKRIKNKVAPPTAMLLEVKSRRIQNVISQAMRNGFAPHPIIYELFSESRSINRMPDRIFQNEEELSRYFQNTSRFADTKIGEILGEIVAVPSVDYGNGFIREALSAPRIDIESIIQRGIDPKYVLMYRRTQPTDGNPNPEPFWTSDFNEVIAGLQKEIQGKKRESSVILVSDLETINEAGNGLVQDVNDDQGISVRMIAPGPFDQSKIIGTAKPYDRASAPAGAVPGVVDWLKSRGHDTAAAVRKAPWIESGLFSLAFLIPFALSAMGADGAIWAGGAVYGLMNAYFGLKHDRVYRAGNGAWTEGPSTRKTKVWLAGVGAVVHLPLLMAAISPVVGIWGYVLGAGLSVGLHRAYNGLVQMFPRLGLPAATLVNDPAVERKTRIQNMMRTLIQFSKRIGNNTSPETPEEAAAIENATAVQIYRGLSNLGQRNPQGSQWRFALSLEERRSLLSFLLAEMELLNRLLVKATNDLAAIDSQRSFTGDPIVKTSESNRLRTEINGIYREILPALQIVGMLGEGADSEFRDKLIYRLVGIVSHPMVDVNLRESFSRFLAERMIRDDDSVAGEVLFDALVPAELSLPRGREFWKTVFTDAWPKGEVPSRLFTLLQADNRTHRRLGLALLSFHGNAEERLVDLIQSSETPIAFRLAALNRLSQLPKVSEATIQNISSLIKSADFIRTTESYLKTQADDSQWTADLFESPLFAAEDGKAFLTGVAVLLGGKLDMVDWPHFQSVGRNIDQARFLSFWDNAHAQMSFGGSMFRSYYGGVKYSGRLLTMVAAHEMVHAFLQSENFGYETVTQKRFHEYMSDMGTESIRDALHFSLGDMMSYAQTAGFFESGDGGVNNQHERARRQLLYYNEALNETTSVSRFHPDRMLEAGVQLMRAGGADAGDPNLTFANLFRGNLGLDPLSPGELKEADVQEGLLSVQTIARWLESAVDRPPVSTAVAPRTVQPRGLLNRLMGFLLRTPKATPPPTRLRSERVGNQWVVSDSQGWRVALPILPVQTVDGSLFPAELPPGYLDVKWDGSIVTSYQGVAEDVPFERMVEMLEKLYRTTSANKLFPRILGVQILPGSSVPRLIVEPFPEGNSFENLGIQTPDADLDQRLSASFSPRLMERFRRGNFNLDQGIYLRHFYLINGEVRYRLPLENYALSRFFDYLNPRTNAPPAGAMPGVVRWLQGRGLDIAGAIRRAPLIESGLFSLAFLVPFLLTALGAEGATWAAGGVYGLMNAYFGLKHDRVYRNVNGAWTESPSTWKTKVWLAGVGAVIHLPLLLSAVSPAVGVWGYVLGAGLSVGMHRLYNAIAQRVGWAAATVAPPAPLFWKAVRSAQTSVFPAQPSDDEMMRQRFLRDKAETALWDLIGTVSPERMVGILQKTTGFRNLQLTGNIEVEYFSEGVHKYVFKVTVERVTPQGAKENLSFLLAMKKAKAADSITREEMKDLEQLRGLGAPLFGGTFTAKRSGEMFFLEEFIEGLTGQQLKDQGLLSNAHRRQLAATLARIGDRLGGKAPSDSTLKNFIIRQGAGHAIMVDIGSGRTNIGPDASGFDLRIFLLGVLKHMTDEKSEDQVRAVIEGLVEGLPAAKARVFVSTLATELRRSPPVNNPGMDHARNIFMEKAAAVAAPPAGAMPGVVDWFRARGLSTAAAVRHAPWIESGAFSIAFFVVLTLAMAGVDGGSWAASGVYGLMNAYFGYKHDTVFRYQNGNWVETRATWKTRLGLAGVGLAIHAPLLLSAWSAPFVGGLWFAILYPFLAAASVQGHRWYNDWAKERGWAAATVGRGEELPLLGEGSFFTVTDMGNGVLRKEVKEYVGPPHRLYRLSESEREKAAALVVEYTNRIRRVVNEQLRVRDQEGLRNKNFVPLLRREGRFVYVDKVDGVPFSEAVGSMTEEMAEEARRDIRGAVLAASDVFDLKYDQMLPLEDGWRIGVDDKADNFFFAASGDLSGWIDAISPWPPESHRVEPPSSPSKRTSGAVEVNYDGWIPRVTGWTSPLERAALTDLQKQVATLLRALPSIREETRNGYKVEVLDGRGARWPSSYRGRENEAYVFEVPSNGQNYWVKVAFGMGVAQLAIEAADAAPATGVPGVREMVDFQISERPLQFSYVVVESPRGQPVGPLMLPSTNNPVETRDAVAARIEAIPVEHVRAAHQTVRLLVERGVTVNPALTRYDTQFGFIFEGLGNESDPLRRTAAEWFPRDTAPVRAADDVMAQVLSAVPGLYPGQSNPYYFAARERVESAVAGPRATDRRISETVLESLRRAWREQIDALRPGNLFPAGFSVRQVAQSVLILVDLLTVTVDALAASVGAVLGGKAAAIVHSLSFAGVTVALAAGWRILTTLAGGVPAVDTGLTEEGSVNPFGWRIDADSEATAERLGLMEDLSRLLLGGASRPVWLGFKDLRRSYRPGVSLPTADSQSAFRAHLAGMSRLAGSKRGLLNTSRWGVNANEVFRAAALRRGQSWGGHSLSRWALAELVLATATPFQRAWPWFHGSVRWALGVESAFLEKGAPRSQNDRLVRAARAVAVLRAAGFSLSGPTTAFNQDVHQEKDRRLLLNAVGVGRADVSVVEDAYNATLEKIGATNLWLNAGTAAFVRLAGGRAFLREGIPAGGPAGTLYFNIDALVLPDSASDEQRGKVAESLEGVLAALSGEYLRDRLVLTTSAPGSEADSAALTARLTREFGPSFRALQDLIVLNETNTPELYKDGALRLSVLSDHAKARGTGEFEVWTHDVKSVLRDRPGLENILVVDILDVAVKFDRMLRQMRFLATNA